MQTTDDQHSSHTASSYRLKLKNAVFWIGGVFVEIIEVISHYEKNPRYRLIRVVSALIITLSLIFGSWGLYLASQSYQLAARTSAYQILDNNGSIAFSKMLNALIEIEDVSQLTFDKGVKHLDISGSLLFGHRSLTESQLDAGEAAVEFNNLNRAHVSFIVDGKDRPVRIHHAEKSTINFSTDYWLQQIADKSSTSDYEHMTHTRLRIDSGSDLEITLPSEIYFSSSFANVENALIKSESTEAIYKLFSNQSLFHEGGMGKPKMRIENASNIQVVQDQWTFFTGTNITDLTLYTPPYQWNNAYQYINLEGVTSSVLRSHYPKHWLKNNEVKSESDIEDNEKAQAFVNVKSSDITIKGDFDILALNHADSTIHLDGDIHDLIVFRRWQEGGASQVDNVTQGKVNNRSEGTINRAFFHIKSLEDCPNPRFSKQLFTFGMDHCEGTVFLNEWEIASIFVSFPSRPLGTNFESESITNEIKRQFRIAHDGGEMTVERLIQGSSRKATSPTIHRARDWIEMNSLYGVDRMELDQYLIELQRFKHTMEATGFPH